MVGTTVEVLFEEAKGSGARERWRGLTDTYVRVGVAAREPLAGLIRLVQVETATPEGVAGQLVL
jgi:tRNA A37 methylthiotransferase MiaB